MITTNTLKKAWALLTKQERRHACIALVFVVFAALSSALMVGSVLPFLSVLSDPSQITRTEILTWAYKYFNFIDLYSYLVFLGFLSFCVILFASLIQLAKTIVVERFTMMHSHTISKRLLERYLSQPYEFFLFRHSGVMSSRILQESQQVVIMFLRPAAEFLAATFTIFMIVGLLVWLSPLVTAIAFSIFGGIYVLVYLLNKKELKRFGILRARANAKRSTIANEALNGIKDIKLLGREMSYVDQYSVPSFTMTSAMASIQIHSQIPQFVMQAISFGGMIFLCIILIDPNDLTGGQAVGGILPTLGVFAFAGQRLLPELSKLYRSLAQIQAGRSVVDTMYEDVIKNSKAFHIPTNVPQALGLNKSIEFRNVSYRYPNSKMDSIKHFSITIKAGEKIGIIGSTGAGKTTLADLVLGLLSPNEGCILVDGTPITDLNLRAWQQSLGYVPQDIFLIDASISENIALGVPPQNIENERVRDAAIMAQLDPLITEKLSDGYDTIIGERGTRLSGGQRQRVGIARSLYNSADLIIFDEATSALDNLTEREVMTAVAMLPGDKTILKIAHRLSTVKSCDRIIVLDNGSMVGCDTWDKLMENNDIFRKIVNVDDKT